MFDPDLAIGRELASWGKVLILTTRGRRTGERRDTAVGFMEEPDGTFLVAAGGPGSDWARNLRAQPACWIEIEGERRACTAVELEGSSAHRAVAELILKYGTPAERLGAGPVFRLVPSPSAVR